MPFLVTPPTSQPVTFSLNFWLLIPLLFFIFFILIALPQMYITLNKEYLSLDYFLTLYN